MSSDLMEEFCHLVMFFFIYVSCLCCCSYLHRVGRTARAGREGYAVTFVTDDDRSLLKAIVSILSSVTWFK